MGTVWEELLVPPRQVEHTGNWFSWPYEVVTVAVWDLADQPAASLLAESLQAAGVSVDVVCGQAPNATVHLVPDGRSAPECYQLTAAPSGIVIQGDAAGRLYGAAVLAEAVDRNGLAALPTVAITDSPDFSRRALYYDCSRGKVPQVETIERLLPLLVRCRVNELQLYVEDVFQFERHPGIGRDSSPFSPADLLRIQQACRRWQIRFVPSLASFGHMEKVLALKAYRHLGEKPGANGYPGGTTLCPLDPGSIALMRELYAEFLPLFADHDFNGCGDEPWELGKGRCADVAGGVAGVYLDFLKQLQGLANEHGKRLNVWADIILNHPERLAEVPKDLVLLNWDYEPDAARAARSCELAEAGLEFLVCPGTHCWKSHGTRLQTAMANVQRSAAEARRWGAAGLMNTNWGDAGHRNPLAASLHSFAHGGAHGWNGAAVDDDSFTERFCNWMVPGWTEASALLQVLGRVQEQVKTEPYFTAVQSLDADKDAYQSAKITPRSGVYWPPKYRRDWIAEGDAEVAARLRHELAPLLNARGPERFPDYQREMVMAANLERYALGRIVVGQQLRAGERDVATARALHADGKAAIAEFASCWRRRNRSSRLADNLRLLKASLAELR